MTQLSNEHAGLPVFKRLHHQKGHNMTTDTRIAELEATIASAIYELEERGGTYALQVLRGQIDYESTLECLLAERGAIISDLTQKPRIEELEARLAKVTAEKLAIAQKFDEWHPDPALMARIIMTSIERESENIGLRDDAETYRAAIPVAYQMGLDAALERNQGFITPYENDITKIGQILAESKRPSVRYRILRAGVDAAKAIRSSIRALTPPADLVEQVTAKVKGGE